MAETTTFELVTPARVMVSRPAGMVVAPGSDGLFGVLPRHAPMISTLDRGVIEIHDDGNISERILIDGGVADITETSCTILAERAESLAADQRQDIETRLAEAEAAGREAEADFLKAALAAF